MSLCDTTSFLCSDKEHKKEGKKEDVLVCLLFCAQRVSWFALVGGSISPMDGQNKFLPVGTKV
jgi:hypothetical protein